ncbi:hypothetical protein [Streptomyces sp. RG80]|uniref:hypothetical protein n=1 Tax=Streptomyces sp. RG80 TaxID=3157340 RepID=UPI00338DDF5C
MFDLRTEAEMRLHSEKTAKELALKKQREDESGDESGNTAPADVESVEVPAAD